jgi:hypothetical protein
MITLIVTAALDPDGRKAHSKRGTLFDGLVNEQLVVKRSSQPFLDGARRLVELGLDPNAILVMRHAGSNADSLRATIGTAAKLTVTDDGCGKPILTKWSPRALGTVPMRSPGRDATPLAWHSRCIGGPGDAEPEVS